MTIICSKRKEYYGLLFGVMIFLPILFRYFTESKDQWLANLLSDKITILLMIPLFICGIILNEELYTPIVCVRMGRNKFVKLKIQMRIFFSIIFNMFWFIFITLFLNLLFPNTSSWIDYVYLLFRQLRLCMGGIFLVTISKSLYRLGLSDKTSLLLTYILMFIEVLILIPELQIQVSYKTCFLFGWIFQDEANSLIVLLILNILILPITYYLELNEEFYE